MSGRMTDDELVAARRDMDAALDLDCECDPHNHDDGCFEHEAATAINRLVADHDRARASEDKKDATIKRLSRLLELVAASDTDAHGNPFVSKHLIPEIREALKDV